ncbi:hypothetical protein CVT25_002881 [Psilocybe cyanescens]|uniref:Uncharacterized protein n=1 Tax=Psilocybe cyanescens TaxID=93625 RepID=A0A409WKU7_PSICY|nr:hypothetical protein CVT25_002881 [Psilocybe cyanescens]
MYNNLHSDRPFLVPPGYVYKSAGMDRPQELGSMPYVPLFKMNSNRSRNVNECPSFLDVADLENILSNYRRWQLTSGYLSYMQFSFVEDAFVRLEASATTSTTLFYLLITTSAPEAIPTLYDELFSDMARVSWTLLHFRRIYQISRTRYFSRTRLSLQWLKLRKQRACLQPSLGRSLIDECDSSSGIPLSELGLNLLSFESLQSLEILPALPKIKSIPLPFEVEDAVVCLGGQLEYMSAQSTLFQCSYLDLDPGSSSIQSQTSLPASLDNSCSLARGFKGCTLGSLASIDGAAHTELSTVASISP